MGQALSNEEAAVPSHEELTKKLVSFLFAASVAVTAVS